MPAIGTVGVDVNAQLMVKVTTDAYGRLDIVANNAGNARQLNCPPPMFSSGYGEVTGGVFIALVGVLFWIFPVM